tara:strand:- start:682 stop:1131 length:450 start_codon:yes stop_codon:yes gene_type:complete
MSALFISKILDIPPEIVYAWWTDLQSTDSKLVKPLKSRKIISKSDDIIIEDVVKLFGKEMRYTVKVILKPPYEWKAEYNGTAATAVSKYKLTLVDGKTQFNYQSNIYPKGYLTKIFFPIIKLFIQHIFSKEMDEYNKKLEEDWISNKLN